MDGKLKETKHNKTLKTTPSEAYEKWKTSWRCLPRLPMGRVDGFAADAPSAVLADIVKNFIIFHKPLKGRILRVLHLKSTRKTAFPRVRIGRTHFRDGIDRDALHDARK